MSPAESAVAKYDDPGIVATIKATVAKGATDHELHMFLEVCKGTGLNPFLKEIWFSKDNSGRLMIMAARDGYLRVANESPLFDGMETKVERDNNSIPIKAVCTVWRKDRSHPITCEAYYSEYKKASPVWNQYPSAMISKVAEVLALKRSFSINGVVTEEEIGDGEPRGSKEAAQAVADRKLAEFKAEREARKELIYEPVPEAIELPDAGLDPPHDQQLRDSLAVIPGKKLVPKKRTAKQIEVLQWFGPLHDKYKALHMESRYYEMLGGWGVTKSTEFDVNTDKGYAQALKCRNEMQIDVADQETRKKQQEEHA